MLEVKTPNLDMHVLALEQKVLQSANKQTIIEEMQNICGLNPTPRSLKRLSTCKCFPVKISSDQVEWVHCSSEFAVVDRDELGMLFEKTGMVRMLDFSLEEVHSIKLFLYAMGLQNRYLSVAAVEKTSVQDSSLEPFLTSELGRKAYAICR